MTGTATNLSRWIFSTRKKTSKIFGQHSKPRRIRLPSRIISRKCFKKSKNHVWNHLTSWWLNQPIWNICPWKWGIFPNFRVEHTKIFELPPPRNGCWEFTKTQKFAPKNHPDNAFSASLARLWRKLRAAVCHLWGIHSFHRIPLMEALQPFHAWDGCWTKNRETPQNGWSL